MRVSRERTESQKWRRTVHWMVAATGVTLVLTFVGAPAAGVAIIVGWISAWLTAMAVVGYRDAVAREEQEQTP